MKDPGLQLLYAGLDSLRAALDAEDLASADAVVAAYDQALRQYLEERGAAAPVAALRELLHIQNGLLAGMGERRDRVAGELRQARRAGEASRAYATTGVQA